jgi:cytochrome bd ubiquinol oxidase subunit I
LEYRRIIQGGINIKKIYGLVIAVIAFVIFLFTYIIPQQSGFTSSTILQLANLTATQPQYLEQVGIQTVGLSSAGRSIFIAIVMNTHTMFANLQLGGSWIIAITLLVFYRTQLKRYDRIGKTLTLFNVVLFSVGATFALTGMLFFMSLFPQFVTNAFHVWFWPLFFELITFGLEILFLYSLWFSWGRIQKKWHITLAFLYAIDVFIQVFLINTIAAGMLTPLDPSQLTPGNMAINLTQTGIVTMPLDQLTNFWFNGTLWALQFHRVAAALSAVGFAIAMLAMFHYKDRKDPGSKRYWDWVATYAMTWGLLGLILQPALGQFYMFSIQDSNPMAFEFIMHGPRAWAMVLLVTLLSGLFLSVIIYFKDRKEIMISRIETLMFNRLFLVFLIVGIIAAVFLVLPAWIGAPFVDDPSATAIFGADMNIKYVMLAILTILGASILMLNFIFVGDIGKTEWGKLPNAARYAAILAGILATFIIPVMGFVREGGRAPWTVYNIVPVPGGSGFLQFQTPIPPYQIVLVWIAIVSVTITIWWFVFRITAHHPEEKEEISEPAEIPEPTYHFD